MIETKPNKKAQIKPELYTVLPLVDGVTEIDLFDIFCFGVDYGQLLMEEERQGEGLFDAFLGVQFDKKFSMPMAQTETRQVHSEKWFNAKRKSLKQFEELIIKLKGNTKIELR